MTENLSPRKALILDILDEQIDELEKKLKKVQPLLDELNQLKRTRATLLSERTTTGAVSSTTRITMEQVIQALRELEGSGTPVQIAEAIGVSDSTVRSHLNRHKNVRYRKNGDEWALIGDDEDEEEEGY